MEDGAVVLESDESELSDVGGNGFPGYDSDRALRCVKTMRVVMTNMATRTRRVRTEERDAVSQKRSLPIDQKGLSRAPRPNIRAILRKIRTAADDDSVRPPASSSSLS